MSATATRRDREREFHDRLFSRGGRGWLRGLNRLQASARHHLDAVIRRGPAPALIVEVGVGRVSRLDDESLRRGGYGVAVDISAVGLGRAAAASSHDVGFVQADAEMLPLRGGVADLVVGTSIVHHLDVAVTAREFARVLRADGRAVVLEPRRGSPLLRLFRRVTPGFRSPDERPLTPADIAALARPFTRTDATDFALLTPLVAPLLRRGRGEWLVARLEALDRVLLGAARPLGRWAWIVVIELSGPRGRSDQVLE